MRDQTVLAAIRSLHRWSGLCLFPFLAIKIVTGFSITGSLNLFSTSRAVFLHLALWIDIPLILLIMVHATYSVLKIRLGKGIAHKTRAFCIANGIALILFLGAVWVLYR